MGALELLAADRISTLAGINQVILAAADVDAGMMQNLGRHAVANCTRTTSYVSDKDKALKLSKWLHDFPRVGISPPTFVLDGMDTVLVNDESLGLVAHGYIGSSRTVLNDVFALLKHNAAPEDRYAIAPVSGGYGNFWRMKD